LKVDWRLLAVVVVYTGLAAFAVLLTRHAERGQTGWPTERIALDGAPAATPVPGGLLLQVTRTGVTMALPDCNVSAKQSPFFLHVYPETAGASEGKAYVNMDFDLGKEKGSPRRVNGADLCVYSKGFGGVPTREVHVGQFTMPDGKCCSVTWSRAFVFDVHLKQP
jgi:hypothetical protein